MGLLNAASARGTFAGKVYVASPAAIEEAAGGSSSSSGDGPGQLDHGLVGEGALLAKGTIAAAAVYVLDSGLLGDLRHHAIRNDTWKNMGVLQQLVEARLLNPNLKGEGTRMKQGMEGMQLTAGASMDTGDAAAAGVHAGAAVAAEDVAGG